MKQKVKDNDPIYQKILDIMQFKEIAATKFRTFADRPQRAADFISGRFRMSEDEKILFITEISEIRNKLIRCAKIQNEANIKDVMKDLRLKHTHIFSQIIRSRIAAGYFSLDNKEKNELKTNLILLYNRLLLVPDAV